jgi:hypothetical protein
LGTHLIQVVPCRDHGHASWVKANLLQERIRGGAAALCTEIAFQTSALAFTAGHDEDRVGPRLKGLDHVGQINLPRARKADHLELIDLESRTPICQASLVTGVGATEQVYPEVAITHAMFPSPVTANPAA